MWFSKFQVTALVCSNNMDFIMVQRWPEKWWRCVTIRSRLSASFNLEFCKNQKVPYKCARSKYLLCKSVWCNSVLHFKMKQFKYFIIFFLILNKIIEFSCDKNRNKRWLLTLGSVIVNIASTWTFRFRTYFLNG